MEKMRVRIKKRFLSPLSNQMLKVDAELNVPQSQFWFKRVNDKDVEKIKMKVKAKAAPKGNAVLDKPKKGSK